MVLEAMVCSLPVATTRIGGPDGTVKEGLNGYLTQVGDIADLADLRKRIMSPLILRSSIIIQFQKRAVSHHSWRAAGSVAIENYHSVLCGSST